MFKIKNGFYKNLNWRRIQNPHTDRTQVSFLMNVCFYLQTYKVVILAIIYHAL